VDLTGSISRAEGAEPARDHDGSESAQRATFAAGCFWGVEASFRGCEGVVGTSVGYTGGNDVAPSYESVCAGLTAHAESVEVWFDAALVSYSELLDAFWSMHDPTTPDRQGWDFGSQYRSAIFVHDSEQERLAIASRDAHQPAYARPIVTEIVPASTFYAAEDYHQRYFEKHGGAICATTLRDQDLQEGNEMTDVITLTAANFDEEVLRSEVPVIVDYWAPWCGPCRLLGPVIEEIAAERAGTIKVAKVNVDDEPALADRAGVRGIPNVVLYRDGEPAAQVVGAQPKADLERALQLDAPTASASLEA
jgi:peptide-methionine (S)-S-oxide reductase